MRKPPSVASSSNSIHHLNTGFCIEGMLRRANTTRKVAKPVGDGERVNIKTSTILHHTQAKMPRKTGPRIPFLSDLLSAMMTNADAPCAGPREAEPSHLGHKAGSDDVACPTR